MARVLKDYKKPSIGCSLYGWNPELDINKNSSIIFSEFIKNNIINFEFPVFYKKMNYTTILNIITQYSINIVSIHAPKEIFRGSLNEIFANLFRISVYMKKINCDLIVIHPSVHLVPERAPSQERFHSEGCRSCSQESLKGARP